MARPFVVSPPEAETTPFDRLRANVTLGSAAYFQSRDQFVLGFLVRQFRRESSF